ncbi:MAG: response regulator [Candidatus Eremiobacteraeota bacterium]|nr:response regulator [Candidatus Eremiobacteraeota bacterium]
MNVTSAKILVVDDDSGVVKLVTKVLHQQGYSQVQGTTQATEVIDICRNFQPDLLLLDLNMPGLSGLEILELLQGETYDFEPVSVIVLTGERAREARIEALRLGARDYIVKPFDFEVVARIKNLLERHLLSKEVYCHNLELEEKVRLRTADLENAHLETVKRLGIAAEYRDDDTGVHVTRMSSYVGRLARALGEPERGSDLIQWAAKLHDIGKIAIPDAILLKPGKLTFEEFEQMKQHTVIGARILSGAQSELLQMAEVIALSHHEKWDGSGYPQGLAGEAIPRVARIVAVCDVFDALTSSRPYKKAWTVEAALEEIRRGRGQHFDPVLVDVFLENFETIVGREWSAHSER